MVIDLPLGGDGDLQEHQGSESEHTAEATGDCEDKFAARTSSSYHAEEYATPKRKRGPYSKWNVETAQTIGDIEDVEFEVSV